MTKKNIALSIGTLLVVTAPVVTVISCSSEKAPEDLLTHDPRYGTYTQEEVQSLNLIHGQVWANGEPKYVYTAVPGSSAEEDLRLIDTGVEVTIENPNYHLTQIPPVAPTVPGTPNQPNTNTGTQPNINVIEEHRQQAQQHDLTGIVGLTDDEKAIIQTWTDEQFTNFKKLINFEVVTINGTNASMQTPGFDNKNMATIESRTQRAFDIVKNNNSAATRGSWRALVVNPNYVAPEVHIPPVPTPPQVPPVLNQPQPPAITQAPPTISQDDRTLLAYGISPVAGNKLTTPRTLPAESSTWSAVERLVYQWWDNKGPLPTIYTVRRQIISGSVSPFSASTPGYDQIITGPTVPPLPTSPNTNPQGVAVAPKVPNVPTLVEQQVPEIIVPPMLDIDNIPSK